MIKYLINCIIVFAITGNQLKVHAQIFKQFSGKPETFISEVNLYLGSNVEPEVKKTIHEFAVNWDSLKFSKQEKESILLFAKCFIEKKGRANPDFSNFVITLNLFLSKGHSRESFGQWLNALSGICNNHKTSIQVINKLIGHTSELLSKNVIYQSPSLTWKPSSVSYFYKFDSILHLVFEKTDLVCYSRHDSITISGTTGEVIPTMLRWYGKKGKITWERAGYSRDSVCVNLAAYTLDLTKTSYEADSASFTYKAFFSAPISGHFEDNVSFIKKPALATYPVFDSYKKQFVIKNLYPNVNYEGGYSMQGAKLVGKGSIENPARLDFYRKDTLRMQAKSQFFMFRPEKIVGADATVTIYMEQDSIYHGDVQFIYTTSNKEISLVKSENYTAQSPYLDSYHKIDMNFEQLRWRIDEPFILITTNPGSSIGKASFESVNYFNNNEYSALQYYDEINPLVVLKKFADYVDTNRFSAIDLSSFMKRPIDKVHTLLFPLAVKGFIFYNSVSESIELKKRLYNYINASVGRIDYDVLKFNSTTNAPMENASIDLRNNDLKINGMSRVFVSDSQNVVIFPKDENLIMKRNRSFQFDGIVQAGLFTFYGKNFFFNYDSFKIVLKNVDSVRIKVITGYDNFDKPTYEVVKNIVQDVTGEVNIDKPDNKSGLKDNSIYPIFQSYGNSYVYYDDPSVFNGVYKRKRDFYFQIHPYVIDSLNTFKKESMEFEGDFLSAKIFPAIPEKLLLQPDYSLGFKHTTAPDGLPIYEGKGRFTNTIILSNMGLKGDGTVIYLSSTIRSNDIYFFPDSMNTIAPEFTLQAVNTGTQYPQVNGQNIKIHWLPNNDQMQLNNLSKPIHIINNETSFTGNMTLGSKGLTGKGTMDLTNAVASSKLFKYGYATIDADTSSFQIRNLQKEGFSMQTYNVKAHIDYNNRSGTFYANDDTTITKLPENKFIAKIDEFNWKMDRKEIDLISKHQQNPSGKGNKYGFKDENLPGSTYISTKLDQDSLSFVSPHATYNYENNVIYADQIKYIDIADARIFPDKGKITVEKDAKILPLINSKILANTETRFHNIYQATTEIVSRNNYNANGKYDYIDENNSPHQIAFNSVGVDSTIQTIASGEIVEPDNFTLSPDFLYQGKVSLKASEKLLTFNGAVHIVDNCPNYSRSWLMFESPIDPVNVSIPVGQKLVELNRKQIVLGTLITTDSIHIYSSFFGNRKNYNDTLLLTANGLLRFNKDSSTYIVTQELKFKNPQLPDPLVAINRKTCIFHDEGKIKLGIDLGQFKISASGNIDHDLKKNEIKLRLMMSLDFFMYNKSMESMAKIVDSLTTSSKPIDMTSPYYKKYLGALIEPEKLTKYFDELAVTDKLMNLPDVFNSALFLNDVQLFWDDISNSYRSTGKIGIGYINKHKINKYVDGYIEIWRKRTGDIFDIYLKIDENNYYYFGYTRGTMQVLSSDNRSFNDPIRILKDSERNLKTHHNQTPYSFLISTPRKMGMVLNRWMLLKEPNNQQLKQEEQQQEELPGEEQPKEEKPLKDESK